MIEVRVSRILEMMLTSYVQVEINFSHLRNLLQKFSLQEVGIWCKLLKQSNGNASEPLVLRQLERLEEINMTVELLVQTKVAAEN